MRRHFAYLLILVLFGTNLPGCSTLQEAIYGRQNKLAPLAAANLGSTSRDEIIQKYGSPDEIDRRWFDSQETEVYFYQDRDTVNNRVEYQFLACEFSKGVLRAYSFHQAGGTAEPGFNEDERFKLLKGKSTRHEAERLLGVPSSRALIPTTITLPALDMKMGGAPFPMGNPPEDAIEAWQYYSQNLDDYLNKSAQKTLTVFFDANGIFVGSALLQELAIKAR